jgi:hypothetical protein
MPRLPDRKNDSLPQSAGTYMNAEKSDVYIKIVETLQEVNSHRTFRNIGMPEREDMDKAVVLMEELSWKIISKEMDAMIADITVKTGDLKNLGQKIEQSYSGLKNVAANILKIADAVNLLIKAADIAATDPL